MKTALERILAKSPEDSRIYTKKSIEIADTIFRILTEKGISQKAFANELNKNESEISKWLTGTHNFTLKTLSKIESFLGEEIIAINSHNVLKQLVNPRTKECIKENLNELTKDSENYLSALNNFSPESKPLFTLVEPNSNLYVSHTIESLVA